MRTDEMLNVLLSALKAESEAAANITLPEDTAGKRHNYADFVNRSIDGKLVLLELGVGFNTPPIIRWPFERITARHPHAALIRINLEDACVPREITEKSIAFKQDIAKVIQALADRDPGSRTCLSGRSRPS